MKGLGDFQKQFAKSLDLHQRGLLREAQEGYRSILCDNPSLADVWGLLGTLCAQENQSGPGIALLKRAIATHPENPGATRNLARLYLANQVFDKSLTLATRTLLLEPGSIEAMHDQASALSAMGNPNAVEKIVGRISKVMPQSNAEAHLTCLAALAHLNVGNCLLGSGEFEKSIMSYLASIRLDSLIAESWANCGIAFFELGQFHKAIQCHRSAAILAPELHEIWMNLGNAHQSATLFSTAFIQHQRVVKIAPLSALGHFNLGRTLIELDRHSEALESHDRALEIDPEFAEAGLSKSMLLMLVGRWREGHQLFHWRFKTSRWGSEHRISQTPEYTGQTLQGKSVHLYPEQGYGDVIQFARYASVLADRGAKVTLEVPPELLRIMRSIDPRIQVKRTGETIEAQDYILPLLSVPAVIEETQIPRQNSAYLFSGKSGGRRWDQSSAKSAIGVVWAGNPTHRNDLNRSIPIETFSKVFGSDHHFVTLQKGIRETDLTVLKQFRNVFITQHLLDDFADTATLIETLDLVITVDTSVAHLSGALGKKTWLLLPYLPDYRWFLGMEETPWYPNVRLFRQDQRLAWGPVLQRVLDELS